MARSGITQKKTGALANGKAAPKIHAAVESLSDDLGQLVYDEVKKRLGTVLVNPTGYYESRVQVDNSRGTSVVSDGGVIYGPWLEGTSSRNGRSRFKGYATFRKATQAVEREALAAGEKLIAQKLRSL